MIVPRILAAAILGVLLLAAPQAAAQLCGDVDNSGGVSLGDLAALVNWLGIEGAPPLPNPAMAEMDGRAGITVGDLVPLLEYVFEGGPVPTCGATDTYTFAPSPGDTLFIPRMLGIAAEVNEVTLPLTIHVQSGVRAFNLSFLENTAGPAFRLADVTYPPEVGLLLVGRDYTNHDSCRAIGLEFNPNPFTGTIVVANLIYERYSSGVADIIPVPVNRADPYRNAVARDGDLYVPTVAYLDAARPPDTLFAAPTALDFDAVYGYPAVDTLPVSFTSAPAAVDFTISPDESWIRVVNGAESPWTAPATVQVTVDLAGLPGGLHTGHLNISTTDPEVILPASAIEVNLTIQAPVDTLFVSTDSVRLEAVAGVPSYPIVYVNFSHSLNPLQFNLLPGQSWVKLADPAAAPFTSPATVGLTVNHTGLPIGEYVGEMLVVPAAPGVYVEHSPIRMYLKVTGLALPPGDLNCDGAVAVADVTMLINYLFRNGPLLTPCQ